MNVSAPIIALCMLTGTAQAESMISGLCGQDHINEVAALDDVMPNPDGYYVRSMQTQLSHGDARIVEAVGTTFHLCLRSAATPDMDTSRAINFATQKRIKYLFIPVSYNDIIAGF
jgi:hypothetical protein